MKPLCGISTVLLLFIICCFPKLQAQQCTHFINPDVSIINGQDYSPGDVICLYPGLRSFLLVNNLHGTAEQPITIKNTIGQVVIDTDHFYGLKFSNSKHVRFTGSGVSQIHYGIYIRRVGNGAGVSVDNLSTDFEIDHLRIANTALGGIYAKTDPDCSFQATRDNFTMKNLSIHNNWLHDIEDEGFYIGSSKFTGQYLPDCDTTVLPHLIEGVQIFNNLVERAGWDGIQVSSASSDCQIFNNIVRNDSWRETPFQMSGILIGGGSNCDCYNNQIFDGKGDGIDVFGSGTMRIYNNLIVNAGMNFMPNDPSQAKHGIFIGNAPDGGQQSMKILYNTIISPKTTGIRYFSNNSTDNLIINNIITDPGAFGQSGMQAYVNHQLSGELLSMSNNLFTTSNAFVKFVNFPHDFDLLPDSPAVNKAIDAGEYQIEYDILLRPRPHNQAYDIGAFESQHPYASISDSYTEKAEGMALFYDKFSQEVTIWFAIPKPENVLVTIYNSEGKLLESHETSLTVIGKQSITLSTGNLSPGLYVCRLLIGNRNFSRTFIIR